MSGARVVLVALLLLPACAAHLDLAVTPVSSQSDLDTLRDEVRAVLRDVGLQCGPLDEPEVDSLLRRLRPEQERARGPLERLRRRLRRQ